MDNFFDTIATIITQSRVYTGYTVDLTAMCITYFWIGHMIVEQGQPFERSYDVLKKFLLLEFFGVDKNIGGW
ncbi:MAG: hypothetical protein LBC03_03490 [Nitrososphaerota archaeon]|nr:hypothetical protein [Nitrososphaerota archaeon]